MPEHIWSVLCYKGCLDKYSNQVSLLDVIEGFKLRSRAPLSGDENIVVALPFALHLVSLWGRVVPETPERFGVRLVVVKPGGVEVPNDRVLDGDLMENKRLRTFLRLEALPYGGSGLYRFAIECRSGDDPWRRVASLPVEVDAEIPPPAESAKGGSRPKKKPKK